MKLQKSSLTDVPAIMDIISDAQSYLAHLGIDQWQDGYPTEKQILVDIQHNDSYVILNELNIIMGTMVFTTKPEATYHEIEGKWLTNQNAKYGVVHRLAVGDDYRKLGLAKFVFNQCHQMLRAANIDSLRIDTHRENIGMQNLLKSFGYTYCGVIYLDSGDERLAFELLINKS